MSVFNVRATGTLQEIDAAEVRRAASILFDPSAAVMIQGLPCARHVYCDGMDLEAVVRAAKSFADQAGIYWSLNPCPLTLDHCLRAGDVLGRKWLLIDVDPCRPPDSNATENEHTAAQELAGEVMDWLSEFGWPIPVSIDSGNGWHLLYRIDLPNSPLSQAMLRNVLHVIGDKFDVKDKLNIDRAVHDAKRISKLPGTWARKGPHSDERPHRKARIVYCPTEVNAVTAEQLSEIGKGRKTKENPAPPPLKPRDLFKLCATDDSRRTYANNAVQDEIAKLRISTVGTRNNNLYKAAACGGNFIAAGLLMRQKVEGDIRFAAQLVGLSEKEITQTMTSGIEKGMTEPRVIPERNGVYKQSDHANTVLDGFDSILVKAGTIKPRKIEWLWRGRIPIGKLTTFAGQTSIGKTFALCDITARVSKGMDWPDSQGECCEAGDVLFITGEDDPDDTLVPRLIELGADLDRISFLRSEVQDQFKLSDLAVLDRAIKEAGPSLKLICIDPPTAFLGDVDDHKNAELRRVLSPLKSWAAQNHVAIVFITHVNKPSGQKVAAIMRVIGSVAWINAVRAAHCFAKDPEDPDKRLFCCLKMNIAKEPKGLAYRMVEKGDSATIEWLGHVDITADDAMSGVSSAEKRKIDAAEWLVERFRERLEWPSDDLMRAAREDGVSRNALFDAKTNLDMPRARRTITESGDKHYTWWVPADWPPFTKNRDSRTVEAETF